MKPIRSILAATDLGEGSEDVPKAAAALAELTGADLHVMHALDIDVEAYLPLTREMTFVDPVTAAERLLEEQIEAFVPPGVRVASRRVDVKTAHNAILTRAKAVDADLVVLGAHRRLPVGDRFLGGTADRVIRDVEVPCLLIRDSLSLPLRHVLVPYDLSNPARGALEIALDWASSFRPGSAGGTRPLVTVAHIVPTVFRMPEFDFDQEVIVPEIERQIADLSERAGGPDGVEIRTEVHWGDSAATGINELARNSRSDLIVVSTRGHGAIRRALIGSVARGIARGAPCPVLLVPPALRNEAPPSEDAAEESVPPFGA